MVAGHGITHSERTDGTARKAPHSLLGLQNWMALLEEAEDAPADFVHAVRDTLPMIEDGGARVRLILGTGWGMKAPVTPHGETIDADVDMAPGAQLPLPGEHEDRGIYVLHGAVTISGATYEAGRMLVFRLGDALSVSAGDQGARLMVPGGATMDGPRHIWWNFGASSRDRIDAAKEARREADWQHGRFQLPPRGRRRSYSASRRMIRPR